jgi:hypothetical protein
MPDLLLGPDGYRKKDPRTGKWRVPDHRLLALVMALVSVAGLTFTYFVKDQITTDNLFWGAVIFAFNAGGLFAIAFKDVP